MEFYIPDNLKKDMTSSKFIFFSHGHPDHLNPDSLHNFKNSTILLGDHVGGRIYNDLTNQGFKVSILPERKWSKLSENVSVMGISTKIQIRYF